MHHLNSVIARKPAPVESQNRGKAVHPHGRHQSRIVRGLPNHPMLKDQTLPDWINRGRLGQELKDILDPGEFHRNSARRHSQPVLLHWPRGNYPQLDEILREDVKLAATRRQGLERVHNGFVVGMPNLQGPQKYAGVNEQRKL